MTITIKGYSDDLIEVKGDITEEFDGYEDSTLVALSNGVLLRVNSIDEDGIWRIIPLAHAELVTIVHPAADSDTDSGTDVATIEGPIEWVASGDRWANQKGSQ